MRSKQNPASLFDLVAEALSAGIDQIAHEIVPDLREKLVEEPWFGRVTAPSGPEPREPGQGDISLHADLDIGLSIDLDIER